MEYKVPDINTVMGAVPAQNTAHDEKQLIEQGHLLTRLLNSFSVSAQVSSISPGPVVTRYELRLSEGVKSNAVENLATDIAMGLKARSIRVVPITERAVVAVEIPNKNPQIVHIRNILNDPAFQSTEGINVILGRDIAGNPVMTDITKAPHMIVAGQTGSGKSMGVNVFLISMLATKTPEELRLVLIDPKIVELSPYNGIPHLITPVVTDFKKAMRVLDWVIKEMEKRYRLLGEVCSRNITGYNTKAVKKMPYLVVVIDEMADLMMVAGKRAAEQIVRIAQKARAVGIHLILTTQRPSVNVITGLIKANVPTRVGFQTASNVDSRIIMDKSGCELLLGRGDMLFQGVGDPDMRRVHGAFVDYNDVDAMVAACSQMPAEYVDIDDDIKVTIHGANILTPKLLSSAMTLVEAGDKPSTSLFQRKLNISFSLAEQIMEQLKTEDVMKN